jgi:hypothetical protein
MTSAITNLFFIYGSDFKTQLKGSEMVSNLYKQCLKASKRDDGSVDLCDEDAVAYAR